MWQRQLRQIIFHRWAYYKKKIVYARWGVSWELQENNRWSIFLHYYDQVKFFKLASRCSAPEENGCVAPALGTREKIRTSMAHEVLWRDLPCTKVECLMQSHKFSISHGSMNFYAFPLHCFPLLFFFSSHVYTSLEKNMCVITCFIIIKTLWWLAASHAALPYFCLQRRKAARCIFACLHHSKSTNAHTHTKPQEKNSSGLRYTELAEGYTAVGHLRQQAVSQSDPIVMSEFFSISFGPSKVFCEMVFFFPSHIFFLNSSRIVCWLWTVRREQLLPKSTVTFHVLPLV